MAVDKENAARREQFLKDWRMGKQFYGRIYEGISLHDIDVVGTSFRAVVLDKITISDGNLASCCFAQSALTAVVVQRTDLSKVNLSNLYADNLILVECKIDGMRMEDAYVQNFHMIRCDGTASFKGSHLGSSKFIECDLEESSFEQTDLFAATFSECGLKKAIFPGAILGEASFKGSNLTNALVHLKHTRGEGGDMSEAIISPWAEEPSSIITGKSKKYKTYTTGDKRKSPSNNYSLVPVKTKRKHQMTSTVNHWERSTATLLCSNTEEFKEARKKSENLRTI